MLTAYDYSMINLINECGVNGILLGVSLEMLCIGHKDTLSATIYDMLHRTKVVLRDTQNAVYCQIYEEESKVFKPM